MKGKSELFYLKQLGIRLIGLLILWAICRLGFYTFNQSSFPIENISELGKIFLFGTRFDLASIIYVNLLFSVLCLLPFSFRKNSSYQKFLKYIFLTFNGLALYFEVVDIGYFRFAFRRFIGSDLFLIGETTHLFFQFIKDFWYLALLYFALLWVLNFIYKKTNFSKPIEELILWKQIGILVFTISLLLIGARGGIQKRPIMALTAAQYVNNTQLMPLQSNTTLNILFSAQQRFIEKKDFFSKKELDQYLSLEKNPQPKDDFKKENVFIIVLESFGKGAIGYYSDFKNSPTPFLDSLIEESWNFENAFAVGSRSTQGIAAITTGIPALMDDPIMFSAYQTNQINGLPKLLENKNYHNGFFHGSNPESMEFERFSKIIGYQEFHDRTKYPDQTLYDGNWGIWDIPFFQYTLEEVNKYNKPFTALLFSLTSHHPYEVEDWFQKKHPDEKPILRAIRYTDYALRKFFETAKKTDWYDNTLFIITADHRGKNTNKKYRTQTGIYQIPLLFFKPNSYLNFGSSAFDTIAPRFAYAYRNGIYQIIDANFSYTTDLENAFGLYEYPKDPFYKKDVKGEKGKEMNLLDKQLKAMIQVHHDAMINNKLSKRK